MMKEFDCVTLTRDLPESGLRAGMSGAITDVRAKEGGYNVEFFDDVGETVAVEFVAQDALRLTTPEELAAKRARRIAAE